MKYLIVGLGNVGAEYENTRHNIGFKVTDYLAKENKVEFSIERHAFKTEFRLKSKILVLIKPTTFMNLSGKAVKYWMTTENISLENVLVIVDDIALPLGKLRMKMKGGDGNHNGLTSITQVIGNSDFSRLRFGIGSDFKRGFQSDFVLGPWNSEESKIIDEKLPMAAEMVKTFCLAGVQLAMTQYNNK